MTASQSLRLVKVAHTVVWAVFVACILAIPLAALRGATLLAWVLIAVVFGEVLVLAVNHWRCPLTAVAARYTSDRRDNFDIYLPLWLARYNKHVFGTLYVVGIVVAALAWASRRGLA